MARQQATSTGLGLIRRDAQTGLFSVPQCLTCRAVLEDDPAAPQMFTSLDANDPEQANHLFKTVGEPDYDPAKMRGEVFRIKWFVVARATVRSKESGKLETVPRVTWIDPSGKCVAFTSWAACRYMDMILATRGMLPYDPPISITVDNIIRDDGKRTYGVELVAE